MPLSFKSSSDCDNTVQSINQSRNATDDGETRLKNSLSREQAEHARGKSKNMLCRVIGQSLNGIFHGCYFCFKPFFRKMRYPSLNYLINYTGRTDSWWCFLYKIVKSGSDDSSSDLLDLQENPWKTTPFAEPLASYLALVLSRGCSKDIGAITSTLAPKGSSAGCGGACILLLSAVNSDFPYYFIPLSVPEMSFCASYFRWAHTLKNFSTKNQEKLSLFFKISFPGNLLEYYFHLFFVCLDY